jgi:IstB-like ATP binding protein
LLHRHAVAGCLARATFDDTRTGGNPAVSKRTGVNRVLQNRRLQIIANSKPSCIKCARSAIASSNNPFQASESAAEKSSKNPPYLSAILSSVWPAPLGSAKPTSPSPSASSPLNSDIVSSSYPPWKWHAVSVLPSERIGCHAMKMLTQPRLLIVDEVGYLGLDQAGAAMLFQVICNRYKNAATIITSNRPFANLSEILTNGSKRTALLMLLVDNSLRRSSTLEARPQN